MPPAFLIAGATGNTGRAVVKTLSELLKTTSTTTFANYRILALTRSSSGAAAQQLAQLPGVEVAEKAWVEITADWLRENNVVRAFIASHNEPNQFAEESTFSPRRPPRRHCPAYYARAHWAVEALLSSPEFGRLRWTSLQPNIFTQLALMPAVALISKIRETGKQDTLRLLLSEDAPVGIIDSDDVGILAAHLLVAEDVAPHNKAKYVLNGPENISGRQIVAMAQEYLGTKVETVAYKDTSFIEDMAAQSKESRNVILSIKHAADTVWEGKCAIDTTSKEIFSIAAPKRTPAQVFKTLLGE
ncbi:hypothetical protein NHJ13051_005922 [Beauveria bassiana]